jgi:hypothetical protein
MSAPSFFHPYIQASPICLRNITTIQIPSQRTKPDSLYCNLCGREFTKEKLYKQHMLIHSFNTRNQCKVCWKKFKDSRELYAHRKTHNKYKNDSSLPLNLLCESKTELKRKQKLVHTDKTADKTTFECLVCNEKFPTKYHFIRHQKVRAKRQDFKCKNCEETFEKPYHLRLHLAQHLQQNRKCSLCNLDFITIQELKSHNI